MILLKNKDEKTQEQQQIQLKLSTIFKHKVIDTPQAFREYAINGLHH
jgi:hypothetical protein